MKVYLDNCCFNRPYDDQSDWKIRVETEGKQGIQDLIKAGQISLAWSYILDFENSKNPNPDRRSSIRTWKTIAVQYIRESAALLEEMDRLVNLGIKPLDALHVACAISAECTHFITTDNGILKKSSLISGISIVDPVDFIRGNKHEIGR